MNVGKFRHFVKEIGYFNDADKLDGKNVNFDPKGGHKELYVLKENGKPICRRGNYFDVPGNARCAVRLGLHSESYSDSRDGFHICLGVEKN